jgi:flavorubredoxin
MMPCCKALRYAVSKIKEMEIECIAPQHGSILQNVRDISFVIQRLESLEEVGIDAVL